MNFQEQNTHPYITVFSYLYKNYILDNVQYNKSA